MSRYAPIIQAPVSAVPLVGATMRPEREREIARKSALRGMPFFGLEPLEINLGLYYAKAREALV